MADTVEAITSNRPHRPAASLVEASAELIKKNGSIYDPDVVNAFQKLVIDGGLLVKGWVEQMQ